MMENRIVVARALLLVEKDQGKIRLKAAYFFEDSEGGKKSAIVTNGLRRSCFSGETPIRELTREQFYSLALATRSLARQVPAV